MPDIRPYASHDKIQVRFVDGSDVPKDDRDDFQTKIFAFLDLIAGIPVGKELLDEIQATDRDLFVQKAKPGLSNQTAAGNGKHCFVTLRQALNGGGSSYTIKDELATAMGLSCYKTVKALAERLVSKRTDVTVQTSLNLQPSAPVYEQYREKKKDWKQVAMTQKDMENLLDDLLKGKKGKKDIDYTRLSNGRHFVDELVRAFYVPYGNSFQILTPGMGTTATLTFDADLRKSCWYNIDVDRPPAIGFAHELVHAWRNMKGLRYFPDKEKVPDAVTPDDEVMTTGFPPYTYEKFSENIFRSLWGTVSTDGKLPPRHSY